MYIIFMFYRMYLWFYFGIYESKCPWNCL